MSGARRSTRPWWPESHCVSETRDWVAEPPQAAFLSFADVDEAMYGGARQGGKSDALLIFSILRRNQYPGSKGLILRRTLADLTKEGALIPRSHELLQGIATFHKQEHRWRFPNGGVIEFSYCEHDEDVYNFQGSQYDDICIDQAEQFTDWQFRVLRPVARTVRKDLKPLIRLTANPGGRGHTWLKMGFVDPAPVRTVFTEPGTGKTRVFVPATVYDNPHVSASTIRDLEGLPEPLKSAWLLGSWNVFVGQFFPEWDTRVHVCSAFDILKDWRRFGMLDYGYSQTPLAYLQAAIAPDKRIYVYREIVRRQMVDEAQAEEIAHVCADDSPQYVVAGPDLWNKSGKGPKGQSTAETYRRVWERLKFGAHLQMADNDRVQGWRRVRQYLAPFAAADGTGQTSLLQVFEGSCQELCRTMPGLIFDDRKPEDCDTDGEDDAPDALRYGLMSRPAPKLTPVLNAPSDFDVATAFKMIEDRRKRMRYIGGELEWMHLRGGDRG